MAADQLRANGYFASNEYFLPVMGLIFLRHAYSRYSKRNSIIWPAYPMAWIARGRLWKRWKAIILRWRGRCPTMNIRAIDYVISRRTARITMLAFLNNFRGWF